MLPWLQNFAGEGGFWIVIGVVSFAMIAAAIYWRRPLEGEAPRKRYTPRQVGSVLLCVLIAVGMWLLFAHMIGSR